MTQLTVLGFLRSDVVYIAGLKDLLNCKLDYFGWLQFDDRGSDDDDDDDNDDSDVLMMMVMYWWWWW